MELQQEFPFTLPKGYRHSDGRILKQGVMRLATALDEMEAMNHPKAKAMNEYVTIVLLSKVIVQIEKEVLTPEQVASFYSSDVNFLQNLYQTINQEEMAYIHVTCPHCQKEFDEPLNFTMVG